jgi:BASS family bile acid:Na+ symporter
MPAGMTGIVPDWLLSLAAMATVFTVMFSIGLGIAWGQFRWIWGKPGLMLRALFTVLVAVPAVAIVVANGLGLPRLAEVGLVLMAVSPGAPVALRKSLKSGGDRSFAPALQIVVAILATVSMPLSIAGLNEYYGGKAAIEPWPLAKQVFVAQILPLALGMSVRAFAAAGADWLEPRLSRVSTWLLLVLVVLAIVEMFPLVMLAGTRVGIAIVLVTLGALAVGQLMGGPEPGTRTAVAITAAARNPGLALLVASLNNAASPIYAVIVAYLIISALTVIPYMVWRRRAGAGAPRDEA